MSNYHSANKDWESYKKLKKKKEHKTKQGHKLKHIRKIGPRYGVYDT